MIGINQLGFYKQGSGIHIKKKNRGKFTDYCNGKVTSECIARGKRSKNPLTRKRATFAANARRWKHEEGSKIHKPFGHRSISDNGFISTKQLKKKHKSGISLHGGGGPVKKTRKLDFIAISKDPEYKKRFGWRMNPQNMAIIQDSITNRGRGINDIVALSSQIIPENGGETGDHGNGAFGLIGWRGERAKNLPKTLDGQAHVLMNSLHSNPKATDWTHGGAGTNVNTGKEMRQVFLNSKNHGQATKAFMKGYVRPPKSEWDKRIQFAEYLKSKLQ